MRLWKRQLAVCLAEMSCGREDVYPQKVMSIFKVTVSPHQTDYDPQWTLWKSRLDADAVR